ncbi:MAG TPA: glycosyltransferase family 2 protein, partial [Candidatus Nitrosocosmicus sp.]|nr:glycosyltransferase family 2 protein [Candidatus Nitrosocosmicus sp.]
MHIIVQIIGLFYCLIPRKYNQYLKVYKNKKVRINIFICVCGEPKSIVETTIKAAQLAITKYIETIHPLYKPNLIVLNDGFAAKKPDARKIEILCKKLGIRHIARKDNSGFKAGNINNGFKLTKTSDPHNTLDIILDSDFSAKEDLLIELVKPFKNKKVDFVQSPQRYKNETTWIAQAAAAHQIFFFNYICPSKGHDNALFLCGTNFAIRRSAINDVNGLDTRFITEDYATSLNLHLKGKRGVFMSKVLAEGIAPSNLKSYFNQQKRWSKGSFDVTFAYLKSILFGPLTMKQKLHYLLSSTYYLIGIRDIILLLAPLPYLFFHISLIKANTLQFLFLVYTPMVIYNFILYIFLFKHPIKSLVLDMISFPVFASSFVSSIFKQKLSFIVTIKKYEKENPFYVYKIQLGLILLLSIGILISFKNHYLNQTYGSFINHFWAFFDIILLSLGFILLCVENYKLPFIKNLFFNRKVIKKINFNFHPNLYRLTLSVGIIIVTFYTILFFNKASFASIITRPARPAAHEILVPSTGVYYGYYNPYLNTHPSNPTIKMIAHEKPSLTMFYQDWGKSNSNFDGYFLNTLYNKNIVPIITWEPWDSNDPEDKNKMYSPQRIINGDYDTFIRSWARSAAAYNKPFFLRFAHEMNGNWYPWGGVEENTPEDYILMWRHVHTIFEEEKANNVIWVWSPNHIDIHGESNSALKYYPGSLYVDWVGFSAFNWGMSNGQTEWKSFKDLSAGIYQEL